MAFGFSPKHSEELPLNNLTPEQFLVLAIEAAKSFKWKIANINENGFTAYTKISWISWSEEFNIKIENGSAKIKSECTGTQLTDWGKNKKNIANFIAKFYELKNATSPENLAIKLEDIKPDFQSTDDDAVNQTPSSSKDKITDFFSIFKPTEGYFITPILIILNILIFIIMVSSGVHFMSPESESLVKWGANFRPVTLEGEAWRLLTCTFLHIGVFHLLMNMYALLYIGLLLEPYLGKGRFIAAYLLSGIAASLTSLWWHDLTVSAGASGAIFGMYGVFLAMLTTNVIEREARKTLLTSIGIFVAYNLLNGLKGGIDNAAHIGGLVSGLVIGYAFIPGLKKPQSGNLKLSAIAIMTVVVLSTTYVVYEKLPNDIAKHDKIMEQFSTFENAAMEIFPFPKNASKEELLFGLKENGIDNWNKIINLINNAEKLDLPEEVRETDRKLKLYCELRIKHYQLVYKAVNENSNQYNTEIENYDNQVKNVLDQLNTQAE